MEGLNSKIKILKVLNPLNKNVLFNSCTKYFTDCDKFFCLNLINNWNLLKAIKIFGSINQILLTKEHF